MKNPHDSLKNPPWMSPTQFGEVILSIFERGLRTSCVGEFVGSAVRYKKLLTMKLETGLSRPAHQETATWDHDYTAVNPCDSDPRLNHGPRASIWGKIFRDDCIGLKILLVTDSVGVF